ncbi:thiol-disulfide oxidoreductase DCC family protein [Ferrimonas balearica]|uniref:thiol-disulfide oxidoreductase DCC family protein n=1 Tax=Ferrimonas balearica TaxID=44012 RepID=UPI001F2A8E5F|nr:DUF393 domain-containing protein [Ferrimonas balearica]MBY6095557.1 DUF393 domain-containing protein [Ferrimonas balearica]
MYLTLFFDGQCPLCRREIEALKARDALHQIRFEDLNHPDIAERHPELDLTLAHRVLHGQRSDGTWLTGLDVTHAAWSLVGRGHWTAPLRWRPVKPIADLAYRFFARHRHRLSYLLTGEQRCEVCNHDR